MNIVMLGPFAFTPKATVSARAFPMAQALASRGHRVTILLPPYDHLADASKIQQIGQVTIHNLALNGVRAWTPLSAAAKMAAMTRRRQADIVHVFKPIGYAALAGMILYHTSRLPIVTDTDDWEGTGGWNSVNPYPKHWKQFFDFQERWLPRHSAAVTVASRTLQTQVWGMGVPPERVFYVPNCPSPGLTRREVGEQDIAKVRQALGVGEAPLIMYTGHITLGDDLDLALLALKRVITVVPDARLAIVGQGEGLARLRARADELGIAQAVIFTGWIDHERIPAYLAAADAAIYPYRDSLINRAKCSIKILEYMSMGKAIVTHRVGQNIEYIEHGHSGILAEPGNVEEFAEGLVTVLCDRALAAELGAHAAARIHQKFNWVDRILEVERAYAAARGIPAHDKSLEPRQERPA
jgi:glycosyltransferase involved in cell wall biosynthesis